VRERRPPGALETATSAPQGYPPPLSPRPIDTTVTKAALVLNSAAALLGLGRASLQLHHFVMFADHVATAR
jgi:hypothetical protein